jgi:chromatin remodeling complex protein RSC6
MEAHPVTAVNALSSDTKVDDDAETLITRVMTHVDAVRAELALITGEMKVLRKISKKSDRGARRKRTETPPGAGDEPRKPSGFARPSKLSDELCSFLGVGNGTELPRTVVTKMMCKYIKDNGLSLDTNKRCVDFTKPGSKALHDLLQPEQGATVTYFNLQRYLKCHIRRVDGDTSTSTASVPITLTTTPAVAPEPSTSSGPPRKKKKEG